MSRETIRSLLIDDKNERKFNANHVHAYQVEQVLDARHVVVPNRRHQRAPLLLIGRDHGGACITLPIEPTMQPGEWRPITAWLSKDHEKAKLRQKGGNR